MEAKGQSIVDKAHQVTGAGLEVGGAHWFAQEGLEDDVHGADSSHVDGKIKIQVCFLPCILSSRTIQLYSSYQNLRPEELQWIPSCCKGFLSMQWGPTRR